MLSRASQDTHKLMLKVSAEHCHIMRYRGALKFSLLGLPADSYQGGSDRLSRWYATHSEKSEDGPNIHQDIKWPKHEHPTPYDVFGIDGKQASPHVDPKALKKRYHEFAKLYHPDISQNIKIIRSPMQQSQADKNLLSLDEKLHRFKVMTQAYEILSNSRKKKLYDVTKSGWSYGPAGTTNMVYAAQSPGSHGYRSDYAYAYWNAGTWEDVNNMNSEKQKVDVWTLFIWLCGLVICVQATALLSRIEDSLTRKQYTHEETEYDLAQCYNNYGLDTDKISRFKRFLWFRAYGLYRSNSDLDREAKKNEELVNNLRKKELKETPGSGVSSKSERSK